MRCVLCDAYCVGYLDLIILNVCSYLCSTLVVKLVYVRNNGFKSVLYIYSAVYILMCSCVIIKLLNFVLAHGIIKFKLFLCFADRTSWYDSG